MVAAFTLSAASIVSAIVSGAGGHGGYVVPLLMFAALALSGAVGIAGCSAPGACTGPPD